MDASTILTTTRDECGSFVVVADSGRMWGSGDSASVAETNAIESLYHSGIVEVHWVGMQSVESLYLEHMRKLWPDFAASELPARRTRAA